MANLGDESHNHLWAECPHCHAQQWVDMLLATEDGWYCEGPDNNLQGCNTKYYLEDWVRVKYKKCSVNRI